MQIQYDKYKQQKSIKLILYRIKEYVFGTQQNPVSDDNKEQGWNDWEKYQIAISQTNRVKNVILVCT